MPGPCPPPAPRGNLLKQAGSFELRGIPEIPERYIDMQTPVNVDSGHRSRNKVAISVLLSPSTRLHVCYCSATFRLLPRHPQTQGGDIRKLKVVKPPVGMPSSPAKRRITVEELSTERKKKKKNDNSVARR